jgi:hypothetical protein
MQVGRADAQAHAEGAPELTDLKVEAVELEGVEWLQVLAEFKADSVLDILPPALHPTVPAVVSWLVYRCADSPWGGFSLAQTRVECRSGTRPRVLLIGGVIDNAKAGEALGRGWGFRVRAGEIDFRRGYDGSDVRVRQGGHEILSIGLRRPVMLPPEVVQLVSSLHPAITPRGYRLVQVDPVYRLERAERGEPYLDEFDAKTWGDERIDPHYLVSAAVGVADVTLSKLRYLCRPDELAFSGTEPVA